ncbi:MAG TPA: response regulator [Candidatus Krumholzibacteria bacterium]|nr:response regulator [Candidatus Krumholzibacteria bacterium]
MEITSSSVSVYEVVLDLREWRGLSTGSTPAFVEALCRFMPTTARHECAPGRPGGFHEELRKGTNFAHVIEHVLLELIHLADPDGREFTGWTRDLGGGTYRIHFGAPDFLTGRLAPILAVDIVRRLHRGDHPDLHEYLERMRDPLAWFTGVHGGADAATRRRFELIHALEEEEAAANADPPPPLARWQHEALAAVFRRVEPRLGEVDRTWREAFVTFGGEFARGIVDKVELLNPDRFLAALLAADVPAYIDGVCGLSRMLRGLRIPPNFVTHAAWLYKNALQLAVLESMADEPRALAAAISDLDDLYQNVLHAVETGFADGEPAACDAAEPAVREFRARHVRPAHVLVVDDDAMARRAVRDILEYRGIATLGARDGLSALRTLATRRFEISAVLLDLVLPGLDGRAVCRRVRDSYPEVRIILSSGYPLDQETERCLEAHEVCFLAKPFDSARLIATVRDLLDAEHLDNHAARG